MATLNQNGITFTLNGDSVTTIDGKVTTSGNFDATTGLYTQNQSKLDAKGVAKSFNAVEIDWNGAEITSTAFPSMDRTINTTGDLLSWIKEGIEETAVSGRTSEVVRRSLWIN